MRPRTLTVHEHLITSECLLESWAHESVTGTRLSKNGKVHVEEGQVDHERDDNEPNDACSKVSPKQLLSRSQ